MRAQVNSLVFVGLLQVLLGRQRGTKFLAQAEWTGLCGNDLIGPKDGHLYRKLEVVRNRHMLSQQELLELQQATLRLSREPVKVRLNVVYDSTFAEEYPDGEGVDVYVRNLIYNVQLIYEQPEMSSKIQFEFVVVSLKPATIEFEVHLDANERLKIFQNSSDFSSAADLNILLVFHNLWAELPNTIGSGSSQTKILGLAYMGSFCSQGHTRPPALALTGNSIGGAGQTLAHELAHAFGAGHDGIGSPTSVEGKCSPDSHIMSPSNGVEKIAWSTCTVEAISIYLGMNVGCVYNPTRLASAKPISEYFNFAPTSGNQNRQLLPGKNISLDLQCKSSIGKSASSALSLLNRNGNSAYETCQEHICTIGKLLDVSIGPAPAGSTCLAKATQKQGECWNGKCRANM